MIAHPLVANRKYNLYRFDHTFLTETLIIRLKPSSCTKRKIFDLNGVKVSIANYVG